MLAGPSHRLDDKVKHFVRDLVVQDGASSVREIKHAVRRHVKKL